MTAGHSVVDCWNYTPRQLAGWTDLISRDEKLDTLRLISASQLAQSGKQDARTFVKKLGEEGQ